MDALAPRSVTYSGPIANGLFGCSCTGYGPNPNSWTLPWHGSPRPPRAGAGPREPRPKLAHPLILEPRPGRRPAGRAVRPRGASRRGGHGSGSGPLAEAGAEAARALDAGIASRRHESHRDRIVAARRGALHAAPARARGAPLRRSLAARPRPGEYDRLSAEIATCRARPGAPTIGTPSGTLQRRHPATRGGDAPDLRAWTAKARQFLAENRPGHGFPEGEVVRRPGPFSGPRSEWRRTRRRPHSRRRGSGHFLVRFAPEGASPAEIQQRPSRQQLRPFPRLRPREAYRATTGTCGSQGPGQAACAAGSGHALLNEGWGLTAERLMARARRFFTQPIQDLNHSRRPCFGARSSSTRASTWARCRTRRLVRFMSRDRHPEPTAQPSGPVLAVVRSQASVIPPVPHIRRSPPRWLHNCCVGHVAWRGFNRNEA